MKNVLNLGTYIFVILTIVSFIVIIYMLRSTNIRETFANLVNNFHAICGPGTKPRGTLCVPDEKVIADSLIENGFIQNINDNIIFTPGYDEVVVLPTPPWYTKWLDNNAFACEKLISRGICNIPGNNCEAPCRCADCAGWRGGNKTDCNSKDIGSGRVWCNLQPGDAWSWEGEADKCECSYGYCAVNGLCVSPYKNENNTENTRCCPSCVWYTPQEGGCGGSVRCNTQVECQESIVELPGIKYNVDTSQDQVKIVENLCESTQSKDDCYHPNHVDARRRQPYIIVSPDQYNTFDSLVSRDQNTAAGQNEYDCALKCGETVNSQVECSKRCLPKLWRWLPLFERMADTGGLRYTGGYYQTNQLMRYLPSNVDLRICPENTCETELNLPEISQFNNCTGCENCKFEYSSYINNNGFTDKRYVCEGCKECILDQISANGVDYQVSCKDMKNCTLCQNTTQNLGPVNGLSVNECDTCQGPNEDNPLAGCKIFTLDPYLTKNNTMEYHPQSIIYNHGADPAINYDNNLVEPGYDPGSRSSACDFPVFPGQLTCVNTLNGKAGWGDGFLYNNPADCTRWCDS